MSRSRRNPTPDEMRLWAEVARTVAPLGGREPIEAPREPTTPPAAKPAAHVAMVVLPARPPQRSTASATLADIDRRTMSRVARGIVDIDGRLDLHGMTQQAAHGRLVRFLKEAQADGLRLVLVITGKGRAAPADDERTERGVLRRAVPMWLSAAEMRPFVVGFGEAAPPHGGGGALYIRIRRVRG